MKKLIVAGAIVVTHVDCFLAQYRANNYLYLAGH